MVIILYHIIEFADRIFINCILIDRLKFAIPENSQKERKIVNALLD